MRAPKRILLSGGGTGGHIYPAIAIAQAFQQAIPEVELLFVGAKGGMEERLVPGAGYTLETLPISGLQRRLTLNNILRNLQLPFKLIQSHLGAKRILKAFEPDIAVGTGGYASYPVLSAAAGKADLITALQEQNAYPGLVNRRLAPKVDVVFLGNPDGRKFLDNDTQIDTGNPIRATIMEGDANAGRQHWGFFNDWPTCVVTGGSLGAKTLNDSLEQHTGALSKAKVNVLWQCGKLYHERLSKLVVPDNVRLTAFIDNMPDTLAMADLVVCRAGASTISELIALAKPSILVPSPNVAGDHQTANAHSLVAHNAAEMIEDAQAVDTLVHRALELVTDEQQLQSFAFKLKNMQQPPAAETIVNTLLELYAQKQPQVE